MNEATTEKQNHVIYFDDSHIAAEAIQLPPAMRDLYHWLKVHLRDECHRDVDVLVAKLKDQGVTIDKTNWVRVLKGRWKKDSNGREAASPYISVDNFVTAVTALRDGVRVELLKGRMPFVKTTTYNAIRLHVEKRMRRDRVNRFGVIVGMTGTQKTASYKEIAAQNTKIKWIEAPDNGSIKEFVVRLAVKFGASRNASYASARARIFEDTSREHCIIVDNVQDMVRDPRELARQGKPVYAQPAYQFMRGLQDETDCSFIWSITPESEDQMFVKDSVYHEQFEGRTGGRDGFLRLPDYPPKRDLIQIAEALGFRTAEKHADVLAEIARERGRIRRFFEIMQDAKDIADESNERLAIEHIEEARAERTPAHRK